jgi:vancomycin resistance protein VanW
MSQPLLGALAIAATLGGGLAASLLLLPPPEGEIVAFATSLTGRTSAQRHNAELSANALNGAVVRPGATFSFNHAVKSWSLDEGYVKAPVSYDGELVPAFGGGVCQTSTTLYNAALLCGLPVIERHHHVFAPHYVLPGRDAAVAYPSLDLRFRNPYPFPLRIHAAANGSRLEVSFWGKSDGLPDVDLISRVQSVTLPKRIVLSLPGREAPYHRNAGSEGCRVTTFRVERVRGWEVRRERLSDDSYPTMDRVVTVADR